METTIEKNYTVEIPVKNKLNELVERLAAGILPTAVRKKSFIVNDVPAELFIDTDEDVLAAVLSSLLQTVVNHAENSCIRVTAKAYGDIIIVNITDSNTANSYAVASALPRVQPLAEKIGGYLSMIRQWEKITTITFSFPYQT
jgi:hypothetical protein